MDEQRARARFAVVLHVLHAVAQILQEKDHVAIRCSSRWLQRYPAYVASTERSGIHSSTRSSAGSNTDNAK